MNRATYILPDSADGIRELERFGALLESHGATVHRGASLSGGAWYLSADIPPALRALETYGADASGRKLRRLGRAVRYVETFPEFLARIGPVRADALDPSGSFH